MTITDWIKGTSKAIGGATGASVGMALAEIILWAMRKAPALADIPEGAVQVLVVAACGWLGAYLAPKNKVLHPKPQQEA